MTNTEDLEWLKPQELLIKIDDDVEQMLENGIGDKCMKCNKKILIGDRIIIRTKWLHLSKYMLGKNDVDAFKWIRTPHHKDCFKIHIPKEKIIEGISISNKYANDLLKQSKELKNMKKYQISIPCAILSFEETSKMDYMIDSLNTEILDHEWNNLQRHDFKATNLEKKIIKHLENIPDNDLFYQAGIELANSLQLNNFVCSQKGALKLKHTMQQIQSKFSKIKEMCFYSNWNERDNKWTYFHDIPKYEQKSLCNLVNFVAEEKLLYLESFWIMMKNNRDMKNMECIQAHENLKKFEKTSESIDELQEYQKILNKHFSN